MAAAEERLYFLIQRAAHGLKKRADALLAEAAGLSTAQAAVLALLAGEGPMSQRDLAERLGLRESAMTAMAERLLKAGCITRRRAKEDRRAWVLAATKTGADALAAARRPFRKVNAALDAAFSDAEAAKLAAGLRRLLAALEET